MRADISVFWPALAVCCLKPLLCNLAEHCLAEVEGATFNSDVFELLSDSFPDLTKICDFFGANLFANEHMFIIKTY